MHALPLLGVLGLASLKDPKKQPDGQIDVVAEVPNIVARPHRIDDVEEVAEVAHWPANEMIAQGAGYPLALPRRHQILRKEDWQIGLASQWVLNQDSHQIIQVGNPKPDAPGLER